MKRALLAAALLLMGSTAGAVDYYTVKITGIGIVAGEDQIRFTIDQDPNLIFLTGDFTGEQHKRVVALITAAYTAQSPIYFIRSGEASAGSGPRYVDLVFLSLGMRTWD